MKVYASNDHIVVVHRGRRVIILADDYDGLDVTSVGSNIVDWGEAGLDLVYYSPN